MKKIKCYIKPIIRWTICIVSYLLIMTVLNYTQVIKFNTIIKINFVIISLMMIYIGIKSGKKASKRGYLGGLKIGSLIIAVLAVLNLLFIRSFNLSVLIYYLVILACTTVGSMIGINIKRN